MRTYFATLIVFLSFFFWSGKMTAQLPFQSTGQQFLLFETNELVELVNDDTAPSLQFLTITTLPEAANALAYRSSDRFLYAITIAGNELLRIGVDGALENLGPLPLNQALFYTAGDISPDGSTFVVVGFDQSTGFSTEIAQIDLNDPGFATDIVSLGETHNILDVAFDPTSNKVYGFDAVNRAAINFNLSDFNITDLVQFDFINNGAGIFVDAFGDIKAYGTTAFGTVDALFELDELGNEKVISSSSLHPIADVATNYTSVEVNFVPSIRSIFPCSELEFQYTFANQSGQTVSGLDFVHDLPPGFTFVNLISNEINGDVVTTNPDQVRVDGASLGSGLRKLTVLVEVDEIPGGAYTSQGLLSNLPFELGLQVSTDDPTSENSEDSTEIEVNVIEFDSLEFNDFFCFDNAPYTIVADQFGNNIEWFNGSTNTNFTVNTSGIYTLEASSGCQDVTVTYEIVGASCPYTISLSSQPIPNETFPCNDITWRYSIRNDSGEERKGFTFTDTLPDGFLFEEITNNIFGGDLITALPSQGIRIENMNMPMGADQLEFRVSVGDIPPGQHLTRARLSDLPQALGATRDSDDPNTSLFDSTLIKIFGTLGDSVRIDTHICAGTEVLLDASELGQSFFWENSSTDSLFIVTEPGTIELTLFDGCDPSSIEYHIAAAPNIYAEIFLSESDIHLGEIVELEANIINEDDSLFFEWIDPLENTLSCLDCLDPVAFPLEDNIYSLVLNNEFCQDSVVALIKVDKSRRIYAPNIFSPNGDGINDRFFLQSPDPADILILEIYDRWGNKIFETNGSELNQELSGWDGMYKGEKANLDNYMWRAEIRFIDNLVEEFHGTIMILR